MKTFVRTHLRRKKKGRSIIRSYRRRITRAHKKKKINPIMIYQPPKTEDRKEEPSGGFKQGFVEQLYLDKMDEARHERAMKRIEEEKKKIEKANSEIERQNLEEQLETVKKIHSEAKREAIRNRMRTGTPSGIPELMQSLEEEIL